MVFYSLWGFVSGGFSSELCKFVGVCVRLWGLGGCLYSGYTWRHMKTTSGVISRPLLESYQGHFWNHIVDPFGFNEEFWRHVFGLQPPNLIFHFSERLAATFGFLKTYENVPPKFSDDPFL